MKKLLFVLILAAAAFYGYTNQEKVKEYYDIAFAKVNSYINPAEKQTEDGSPATSPSTSPAPVPAASTPPVAEAPPAPVGPSAQELANLPEGTFYVRERISQMTASGVSSIAMGAKVQKISESNGKYIVDDGRTRLATEPWNLTREAKEIVALVKKAGPVKTVQR